MRAVAGCMWLAVVAVLAELVLVGFGLAYLQEWIASAKQ